MKRFSVWFSMLLMVALLWACTEDNSSIVGSEQAQPTLQGEADAFELGATVTFELTLENLAPVTGETSSQIFSPPVFATHNQHTRIYKVGKVASSEVYQIAEDAVNGPLVDALNGSDDVYAVTEGGDVVFPGASATYTIETTKDFKKLSMITMLVNTNDAFAGLSNIKLNPNASQTIDIYAYDAGSEENTELFSDIPGPCCGNPLVRVPTNDPISLHEGITGAGDLDPALYNWEGPVARLTITRVN